MRHWKPGRWPYSLLEMLVSVSGVLRVHVVPGRAPLLLSKEFLTDLGCHIDLDRGHLFFEKSGVRAVVTSEQAPHLLLPVLSHRDSRSRLKSSHVSALTNAQPTVPLATARGRTKYLRGLPQHPTAGHQNLIAPTLNFSVARMDKSKTPVTKRETTGKTGRDDG